jgi:hypothetical protein
VTPSTASVQTGGTQSFAATPKDQNGNAMSATVTWTVSGGGDMSPATGATSTFTSDGSTEGAFTVSATSGSVEGTATVNVSSGTSL